MFVENKTISRANMKYGGVVGLKEALRGRCSELPSVGQGLSCSSQAQKSLEHRGGDGRVCQDHGENKPNLRDVTRWSWVLDDQLEGSRDVTKATWLEKELRPCAPHMVMASPFRTRSVGRLIPSSVPFVPWTSATCLNDSRLAST